MSPNQMVTARMEQNWETPGIPKRHHMRFFGVKVDMQDSKFCDLVLGHLGSFQSDALLGIENCSTGIRTRSGERIGQQQY